MRINNVNELKGVHIYTSDTGLPDNVGVLEARDDVVGDGEGKFEAVLASFLKGEEAFFGIFF